jgi:putative flavoprotein involved in K+ transport
MATERFDTVVVGGGQAGLSVGYHLARQGRRFVILDAGERVGDSWRRRWDSLRLYTPARYSGLPGRRFPGPGFSYPGKDDVADYLEAYAAHFDLPLRLGVKVDALSRNGNGYVLVAGDRRFEAESVVVASGAYHGSKVPAFAEELEPGILQLDSTEYRNPSRLREGGVLVVGAGNSGAEIALEVSDTHQTWLSGRHPGSEPTRAGSVPDRLLMPLFWCSSRTWSPCERRSAARSNRRSRRGRPSRACDPKISKPPGSSACRGRWARATACRRSRTGASSTWRT